MCKWSVFQNQVTYDCTEFQLTSLKAEGQENIDVDLFVPMDSLGDDQIENNTFILSKFNQGDKNCQNMQNLFCTVMVSSIFFN